MPSGCPLHLSRLTARKHHCTVGMSRVNTSLPCTQIEPVVGPWTSHFTCLCLTFLICAVRIIILTPQVYYENPIEQIFKKVDKALTHMAGSSLAPCELFNKPPCPCGFGTSDKGPSVAPPSFLLETRSSSSRLASQARL